MPGFPPNHGVPHSGRHEHRRHSCRVAHEGRFGRGENDDGNLSRFGVRLDVSERLLAFHLRHFEAELDEHRLRIAGEMLVVTPLIQIAEQILPPSG